ncbi:JmjC domain-containing protein [Shewanella colwelliana]|uniref:JmjC domain-containing protein n=1 Tax=Shewanella colwelliana TaxID=23 RepID=UPI0022B051BC|nr:cupin domain-containing protein [Shewanella colwelliana]MCZ4337692.1 hypothetical protein [Shewanella colwelliana]
MTDRHDALSKLISPLSIDQFYASHYETLWKHFSEHQVDLSSLFTSENLEEYLLSARPWAVDDPWARAGMLVAKFPNGGSKPKVDSVEELLELFNDGHSIVLQQAQKRWPKLTKFCNELSCVLGARIGANIYLTPPGNQGFKAHYDRHDVILLQTEGAKIWKVKKFDKVPTTLVDDEYEFEFPIMNEETDAVGSTEIMLSAGQRLYMPRGTIHQGYAYNDVPSVHITFGIKPVTWFDLLALQVFNPDNLTGELLRSVPQNLLQDLGGEVAKREMANVVQLMTLTNIENGLMPYLHLRNNAIAPTRRFESVNAVNTLSLASKVKLSQPVGAKIIAGELISFTGFKHRIPSPFRSLMKSALQLEKFSLPQLSDTSSDSELIEFGQWLVLSGFATFFNAEEKA